jgi:hypothetical protein
VTRASVDVVGAVERASLAGADASMRHGGFVPEPQMHMIIDDWDQPYVGWVSTRPYYDGLDAVKAINRLGDAPAAIMATRVVMVWEDADLRRSIHGPGEYMNALVIVQAGLMGEHTLRRHPVTLHIEGVGASGLPEVRPDAEIRRDVRCRPPFDGRVRHGTHTVIVPVPDSLAHPQLARLAGTLPAPGCGHSRCLCSSCGLQPNMAS